VSYPYWSPYDYTCVRFRIVVYDDPYYYPYRYYGGTRVVFARPYRPEPRFIFRDRQASDAFITRIGERPVNDDRRRDVGVQGRDLGGIGVIPPPNIIPPRRRLGDEQVNDEVRSRDRRPTRPDQPAQPDRRERPENPQNPDRPERRERPDLPDRLDRPEQPERPAQPERREQPPRPQQPERRPAAEDRPRAEPRREAPPPRSEPRVEPKQQAPKEQPRGEPELKRRKP